MTAVSLSLNEAVARDRLSNFPVSFFSIVMGLAGLTVATRKCEASLGLDDMASDALFWASAAVYVAIACVYLAKLAMRRQAVASEWAHPVRIAFFPAMSIGLILLSIASLHIDRGLSLGLWIGGALLHLVYTVLVITAWINHSHYEVVHLNPAWFIPVVGNILVPIAGIHHAPADISWLYFSVGLLFWLVLLTIVINRLIFHHPLPAKLMPTLFILIAPPAVGFISWTALVGAIDPAARILFFAAVFFFVLMIPQLGKFARIPFALSWWAYSFPLAALTIAHFVMSERSGIEAYRWIGFGLYGLLALVIAGLTIRTVVAIFRGEICTPEH
jgi:tellurite resistance protein